MRGVYWNVKLLSHVGLVFVKSYIYLFIYLLYIITILRCVELYQKLLKMVSMNFRK